MILIPIRDKVTGEDKTIQVKQTDQGYIVKVMRDEWSAGWVEIRLMDDKLFLEVYQPANGIPMVITVLNRLEAV